MSRRSEEVSAETCIALGGTAPALEAYANREVNLGDLRVVRALPVRDKRLVGP